MSRRAALPQAVTALRDVREVERQSAAAGPQDAGASAGALVERLTALSGELDAATASALATVCRQAQPCEQAGRAHSGRTPASPAPAGPTEPRDQPGSRPGRPGTAWD